MEEFNKEKANRIAKENNPNHITENILKVIKNSAEAGQFECKIRSYGFGGSEFYGTKKSDYSAKTKAVLSELRELGFFADIRTEEKQFVDVFLLVSWKD